MIEIGRQPLSKQYMAKVGSRSFFVAYLCYILVVILPAIVLVNIDYSWPTYKRSLITPTLTYNSYQISCVDADGNVFYNSNLESGYTSKSALATVSAGTDQGVVYISGQVTDGNLQACSLQVFFDCTLGSSAYTLGHLPINLQVTDSTLYLSSLEIKGDIGLIAAQPLSQSSVLSINQTAFGEYPYSFSEGFKSSGTNSLLLLPKTVYSLPTYSSSAVSKFSFSAEFAVNGQTFVQQCNLIDQLRSFLPIYMYLTVFLWWVVVKPLVAWMLTNKVYSAKAMPHKIKND